LHNIIAIFEVNTWNFEVIQYFTHLLLINTQKHLTTSIWLSLTMTKSLNATGDLSRY